MVEAVPRNPYGSYVSDLVNVEKSMQLRRKRLHFALKDGEVAPSMSNFPMLGVEVVFPILGMEVGKAGSACCCAVWLLGIRKGLP